MKTTKFGRRLEVSVAADTGDRLQPGSGAPFAHKGDLKGKLHLTECKATGKKQFTLKRAVWLKICHEAYALGLDPVMIIDIDGTRVAVLDYDYWLNEREI